MLLIIALVIASLFVYFLKDKLKQHPNIFYIGAAVVTIVIFSLRTVAMPQFVRQNIVGIFAKGTIGTAFFIIVMITGALPRGSKLIGPLMRIRGELSIMAAILVLSHNLTYGMTYFKMLFSAPAALPAVQRCAAVISLMLIVLMIGLTVISFPAVRKKMNSKKWKQIQRSAYVFYGLLYVHIMLINIPYARMGLHMYAVNVLVYSIVFAGYAAMRIRKWVLTKNPDADSIFIKKVSVAVSVCAVFVCTVAFSMCFMRNGNKVSAQETAADKTLSQTQTEKGVKKNGEAGTTATASNADGVTQEQQTSDESGDSAGDSQEAQENENAQDGENAAAAAVENTAGEENRQEKQDTDSQNSGSSGTVSESGSDTNSSAGGSSGSDSGSAGQPAEEKTEAAPKPTEAPRTFKADGDYTGTAVCDTYGYTVTVVVTISGDAVTGVSASATAGGADEMFFSQANAKVPGAILANGGVSGVDGVSGATKSSNAIKAAYTSAYQSAKN
jgi:DMSO/TMAO reductase YedYZ heme-binding membrane subunit/uncharacterized protein with FMN-binding domain